ncbi:MAG: restriction endonuclease subunit S [Gallionella sp.]|nr:restriction endonuclease subunit S [Gallionella sp.]MCK9355035.1 restriction endonuclease subunit S [Gallionella sp.]
MKQTPLSQLAIVSAGQAAPKDDEFSDHGIPFVRAGSLDKLLSGKSESDLELVSDETAKLRKLKTYPKGTILFAKSGMSATKDRVYLLQNPAYVVSHLAALIPNGNAHADYLRLALKRYPPSVLIKDPAYPAISLGDIQSYEIPIPELREDQIRIAYLLGKVEGLIAQRKQHLQQLDDLLRSVFLEIFGDPVRNEKGWPIKPLTTYMSEQPNNGLYKPQSSYGSGTKIIRIDSFYDGFVQNIEKLKRVEITESELLKFEIRSFDVLVNRVNSIEYLGKIGVVPKISEPMVYESNMMRFRLNNEAMLPVFLMYFWRTPCLKSQLNSRAKKAVNQASVNQQDVLGLLVPGPPIELQKKFLSIFEKVEGIKFRYQQSLNDLEVLYGALSQQTFKGELDLSRIHLAEEYPMRPTPVIEKSDNRGKEQDMSQEVSRLLASKEGRIQFLRQKFDEAVGRLGKGDDFNLDLFWIDAQLCAAEHIDEESEPFGMAEYDQLKVWVFELLESGQLVQYFDDMTNQIALKAIE